MTILRMIAGMVMVAGSAVYFVLLLRACVDDNPAKAFRLDEGWWSCLLFVAMFWALGLGMTELFFQCP